MLLNAAQNIQFSLSLFEFPSKNYENYQENGTKYLKYIFKPIPEQLQDQLDACAGEIFLSCIPAETRAEQVAEVAALFGELYILRFKVNFSGDSRGFAYLQYLNPSLMQLAIARLPMLFRQHGLPMIRVKESRNSSKLLLKKTYRMSPQSVYDSLRKVITFHKLVGREIFPGYFEYQIVFKCNEDAVHARRELLRTISRFGRNAIVVWDTSNANNSNDINNGFFIKENEQQQQICQHFFLQNFAKDNQGVVMSQSLLQQQQQHHVQQMQDITDATMRATSSSSINSLIFEGSYQKQPQ